MLLTENVGVNAGDLRCATSGSYERLVESLRAEVQRSSKRWFGTNDATVLATFNSHALVVGADGRSWRARYELDSGGCPVIVECQPHPLRTYARQNAPDVILRESSSVVGAILEGDLDKACQEAREIWPLVEETDSSLSAVRVTNVLADLCKPRPWKAAFEENQQGILAALGERLIAVDGRRLESKFRKLYDGTATADDMAKYEAVVKGDLEALLGSYAALETQAQDTAKLFDSYATSEVSEQRALAGFAYDLAEDLKTLARSIRDVSHVTDTALRGRLYDEAAVALYRYDAAVNYLGVVAPK